MVHQLHCNKFISFISITDVLEWLEHDELFGRLICLDEVIGRDFACIELLRLEPV